MSKQNYFVATIKPWNREAYHRHAGSLPGTWSLIETKEELSIERIERDVPRYTFFPHWSWKVPDEILERTECVCFHMTDLPFGRGGSPLQNLIEQGHDRTILTALRMTSEIDAGPIYLKRPLSLAGSAREIFARVADLAYEMIREIVREEPHPQNQTGEASYFERRIPEQSALPETDNLRRIYDHIRMLDAETYPVAFMDHGRLRLEFSDATMEGDTVSARVVIRSSDNQ